MDEVSSPAVSVTVSLSSSSCDSSGILGQVEMTRVKVVSETSNLLLPSESVSNWDISSSSTLTSEVEFGAMAKKAIETEEELVTDDSNKTVTNSEMDDSSAMSLPIAVEIEKIEKGRIVGKVIRLGEPTTVEKNGKIDHLTVASTPNVEVIQFSGEKNMGIIGTQSVLKVDCVPLWGSVSICGLRPEMEDTVVAVPWFMKIPIEMFIEDHVMNGLSRGLSHMSTHFFGVYDGHGGCQVAEYCRDRMHFVLGEVLKGITEGFLEGRTRDILQREWEKAFSLCFNKVDEEVGGQLGNGGDSGESVDATGPIAPETAGTTAVVALLCSSHIVVANCGDSRAVLYRGKESIALSVDHKPNREDEYARIEASGGKVIQWNGHRLFGVLAMSRAIGDRYMKPWIIPEPEVMFIPRKREDECLIIASDGLWDVMSNEEACEVARRRILLWHKKNGGDILLAERGKGVDPAAQAAAEYLSALATQKGSKDNISVIVVDLKAQRKFKTKS